MDSKIREAQWKILEAFAVHPESFALAGGSALELFYLHHRFSRDLGFFSPRFSLHEIDDLIKKFENHYGKQIVMENELFADGMAKVRSYYVEVQGSPLPLKIDLVEDIYFPKPAINKINAVPVYAVEQIYIQKILTIIGAQLTINAIGRQAITGRHEARDVIDLYYLSQNILPFHQFLKRIQRNQQRGVVQWYRGFSRQEFKMDFLDLDIYDTKLTGAEVIRHLENEIEEFIREELE